MKLIGSLFKMFDPTIRDHKPPPPKIVKQISGPNIRRGGRGAYMAWASCCPLCMGACLNEKCDMIGYGHKRLKAITCPTHHCNETLAVRAVNVDRPFRGTVILKPGKLPLTLWADGHCNDCSCIFEVPLIEVPFNGYKKCPNCGVATKVKLNTLIKRIIPDIGHTCWRCNGSGRGELKYEEYRHYDYCDECHGKGVKANSKGED